MFAFFFFFFFLKDFCRFVWFGEEIVHLCVWDIYKKVGDLRRRWPFSVATTQRYRGRRYSFPWIAPLYPWSFFFFFFFFFFFWVFGMTRPGIEPRSPGPLTKTLLIKPMARYISKHFIFFSFFFFSFLSKTKFIALQHHFKIDNSTVDRTSSYSG